MSLVWDYFNNSGSEKLVMLAMADWCNDTGGSLHPSIASIAKKTCVSECQARRTVHSLIGQGYLSVVGNSAGGDPGKSRQYQVNLSRFTPSTNDSPTPSTMTTSIDATPSTHAHIPLAPMHVTPSANDSPTPSTHARLTTTVLPRTTKGTTNNAHAMLAALGISKQIADDWITLRKQKRASVTETAIRGIQREADKAGVSLEVALSTCCERGWTGFKAEWVSNAKGVEYSAAQAREGAREMLFGKNAKTIIGG